MDDDSKETNEHQQQQQQQLQPPQGTLTGSYNRNAAALMGPTSTSQAMPHWLSVGAPSLRQPQQPLGLHGSPSSVPTQQPYMQFGNEQRGRARARARGRVKGRPRKYADVIDLSLGPPPTLPLSSASDDGGGGANANSSDPPAKRGRGRGRTPGSVSKKLKYLGGAETLLTPHIININPGEDIAAKVVAFTHQGPLEFSILSASGAVSSAVLLHSKDPSNPTGVVMYEGIYGIIAMSGSFLNTESNGAVTRTSDMNVHLAGPDGRIVVGFVAGMLVAGSQVQVTVGSFVSEKVKLSLRDPDREPASASASGGEPGSPQSQGPRCSSESSDEDDSINNNNHQVGNSTP